MKKSILKIMSIAAIFSLAYLNFSLDIQANSGDLKLEQLKASASCDTFLEWDHLLEETYWVTCCYVYEYICIDRFGNLVNPNSIKS